MWAGLLLALLSPDPLSAAGPAAQQPIPSGRILLEEDWAARLVRELGISRGLAQDLGPAELFSLLCVEQAERPLGPEGRELPAAGAFRVALQVPRPRSPDGPVRVVVSVPATALYQLGVEGVGRQRWVVDREVVGHLDPSALGVDVARALVPLRRGPHEITGILTPSARVDRLELAAHRPLCAAPADGWHTGRRLRHGALARSLVRALDLERRLPERREERVDIEGERFESAAGAGGITKRRLAEPASGGAWAAAISGPTEFSWRLELAEPRVVSLEARTHGVRPQLWSVNGRDRVRHVPESFEGRFAWSPVLTLSLSAGRHVVRARVARGSGVDSLRVVSHRSTDADYAGVLAGVGLPLRAPEALVTRGDAEGLLASPIFAERAAGVRARLAGADAEAPVVLVDHAPDPFAGRPLSPALPADL